MKCFGKRFLSLFLVLALLLGIGMTSAGAENFGYAGKKGTIVLKSDSKATLAKGEKLQVALESGKIVSCKSNKTNVATVSASGAIKAKKDGKAKIRVKTDAGVTYILTLTVVDPKKPDSISFKSKSVSVFAGMSKNISGLLKAKPYNETFDIKSVKWSSSDTGVVKVSSKGVISGQKAGTKTVTVKTKNNKKAEIKVTVKRNKATVTNSKPRISSANYYNYNLVLKSVEIVSPRKVTVEYYLAFNYPENYTALKFNYLDTTLYYYDSNGDLKTLVNGEAKNVKISGIEGQDVGTVKVTYSGSDVSNTNIRISEVKDKIYYKYNSLLTYEYDLFKGTETKEVLRQGGTAK